MADYSFEIYATGPEVTPERSDAIAEALGGEPDVSVYGGPDHIEFAFDREAATAAEALASAVRDVESWGYTVLGMGPGPLIGAREIAARIDCSRQYVNQLAAGTKGPGGFPPPAAGFGTRTRTWVWSEVIAWFEHHGLADFTDADRELAGELAERLRQRVA